MARRVCRSGPRRPGSRGGRDRRTAIFADSSSRSTSGVLAAGIPLTSEGEDPLAVSSTVVPSTTRQLVPVRHLELPEQRRHVALDRALRDIESAPRSWRWVRCWPTSRAPRLPSGVTPGRTVQTFRRSRESRTGQGVADLGPIQVAQPEWSALDEPHARWHPIGHQPGRGLTHEDPRPLGRRHEPGGPVHRRTEEVAVALRATLPCAHREPDGEPCDPWGTSPPPAPPAPRTHAASASVARANTENVESPPWAFRTTPSCSEIELVRISAWRARERSMAARTPTTGSTDDVGQHERDHPGGQPPIRHCTIIAGSGAPGITWRTARVSGQHGSLRRRDRRTPWKMNRRASPGGDDVRRICLMTVSTSMRRRTSAPSCWCWRASCPSASPTRLRRAPPLPST